MGNRSAALAGQEERQVFEVRGELSVLRGCTCLVCGRKGHRLLGEKVPTTRQLPVP